MTKIKPIQPVDSDGKRSLTEGHYIGLQSTSGHKVAYFNAPNALGPDGILIGVAKSYGDGFHEWSPGLFSPDDILKLVAKCLNK